MREIKFRGKRTDNGEWVYGYLTVHFSASSGYDEKSPHIEFFKSDHFEELEVDPKTVGQFTSLWDKNGNEIFDKDIIRSYYSDGMECKHLIGWVNAEAAFVAEREDKDGYWRNNGILDYGKITKDWITKSEKEVIGNAIDNPELMIYFTK